MNRLLLITPDFSPNTGGVARYLGLLASYFQGRLRVISSTSELLSSFIWPHWLKTVLLLLRLRREHDLVMTSHILPFGTATLIASWLTKKPYIIFVHGMDVRLACTTIKKKWIASFVLKHARVVVANSNALSQEIAELFHVPLPLVVYPCVDSSSDRSLKPIAQSQIKPFIFLTVSRLVSRKGHVAVLSVLAHLKQSEDFPVFEYHIVGSGPMEETLKEMVSQLNLSEVVFFGTLSDEELEQQYASADLFVMPVIDDPVDKEGFGTVFLEAARFGVPSISTRISGIEEAILDGKTGILIPPRDQLALQKAILELVLSPEERMRLGNNARARVFQEFTAEKQFSKLEAYV